MILHRALVTVGVGFVGSYCGYNVDACEAWKKGNARKFLVLLVQSVNLTQDLRHSAVATIASILAGGGAKHK